MDPFAPLGRDVRLRGRKCGYSPGDAPVTDCQADAAWHIAWDTDLENGLACDPHMTLVRARYMFVDAHRISPDCQMPGAHWDFDNKRCIVPDAPAELTAAAEQTATA
ncbi:hypothetical protein ACIRJS_32875 [Streptomyces sp. NPDC102340]|uniref:hypothetical protein n=1 Tax=unclassified Streptomyces TaxID=2593676 RepID=UPI0038115869